MAIDIAEVVLSCDTDATVILPPVTILVLETAILTVDVGVQGIKGADGANSTSTTKTATENLGGYRVVVADGTNGAKYADNTNLAHKFLVLGITNGAASSGAEIEIRNSGELEDLSWNWTIGNPIFCGSNAVLTQTPPSTGFLVIVGVAISATKILVKIYQSIVLV